MTTFYLLFLVWNALILCAKKWQLVAGARFDLHVGKRVGQKMIMLISLLLVSLKIWHWCKILICFIYLGCILTMLISSVTQRKLDNDLALVALIMIIIKNPFCHLCAKQRKNVAWVCVPVILSLCRNFQIGTLIQTFLSWTTFLTVLKFYFFHDGGGK